MTNAVMGRNENVSQTLHDAVEGLLEDQFNIFKRRLQVIDHDGKRKLPRGQLDNAGRSEVINFICDFYGEDDAVNMCVCVLEDIGEEHIAAKLKGATQKDPRLTYRDHIKDKFKTMKVQNSLLGEHAFQSYHYSKLTFDKYWPGKEEKEHEIMISGWKYFRYIDYYSGETTYTIENLLNPDKTGVKPQIVVLQGAAGIGKTTTARKIMFDWASGQLYQDMFNYVFYINCRELNLCTEESSIAEMIFKLWPQKDEIKEILRNPKKLLFIIDGFDELRCSIGQQENCLCADPWKKEAVGVLLGSLFWKKVLPESYLIITTRPTAQEKLKGLECSRYIKILGFSKEDRQIYFHKFFDNKDQATEAFRRVKQNETLFTMCLIPLVCWIICTVLKQQMESGEDLGQTSNTLTAVYMLYLSSLLKLHHRSQSKGPVGRNLKGLCSLAADGIWKREILFWEEEIKEYGLDQGDSLPLFLNETIFRRDIECECAYSFIHLSFQEFFAALSYVLEEGETPSSEKHKHDVFTLLESYATSRPDLEITVRFLFGLVNEGKRMKDVKEKFGWKFSPKVKEVLLEWVKNTTETATGVFERHKHPWLECLYETQEEDFVERALDHVTEVTVGGKYLTKTRVMAPAYCLEHCCSLEVLHLQYHSFMRYYDHTKAIEEEGEREEEEELLTNSELQADCMDCGLGGKRQWRPVRLQKYGGTEWQSEHPYFSGRCDHYGNPALFKALQSLKSNLRSVRVDFFGGNLVPCGFLASLFSIYPTLSELDLGRSDVRDSGLRLLAEGLKHPNCQIKKLGLYTCQLTGACCGDLASVLCIKHTLKDLDLSDNALGNSGVRQLCKGLKHPDCKLQRLVLSHCSLTGTACCSLATVLHTNQMLTELDLRFNKLGNLGMKLLRPGLRHPACKLENLQLIECRITTCGDLSSVLCTNQMLKQLDLRSNKLKDSEVRLLCEGLKHANCKLQVLSLFACCLTANCCEALSSVLITTQTLKKLDLTRNPLDDSGMKLLCEGLKHSDCKLQSLRLSHCSLTQACCGDLAEVLSKNQTLTELDLSWNKIKDTGVELLCEGLKHPDCKLEILELHGCDLTPAVCDHFCTALTTNQLLTRLHVSHDVLTVAGKKLLSDALKHSGRRQQALWLKGIVHDEKWKIPRGQREKADKRKVVDLMCEFYGEDDVPALWVHVLEDINMLILTKCLKYQTPNYSKGFDIATDSKGISWKGLVGSKIQPDQQISFGSKDAKGPKCDKHITLNPLPNQFPGPEPYQDPLLDIKVPDLIRWDEVIPSPISPFQQDVEKKKSIPLKSQLASQASNDPWEADEYHLFASFSALPQAEQTSIIQRLDMVRPKLLSLSSKDGTLANIPEALTAEPTPTIKVISPVCIVSKPNHTGTFHSTDSSLQAGRKNKLNAAKVMAGSASPMDWVSCQFLEPNELGSSPTTDPALLAHRQNKIILNGSTPGDLKGEFTFSSTIGSSVVDYVLVSQPLRELVQFFCIDDRTDSDHYPLVTLIGSPINIHLPNGPPLLDSFPSICEKRIKWSNRSGGKFVSFTESPACVQLYQNVLASAGEDKLHYYEALITDIQKTLAAHSNLAGLKHSRSGQYIPAAIQIYKAKTLAQLTYGVSIWILGFNSQLERIQSIFLRKLLGLPFCASYFRNCTFLIGSAIFQNKFQSLNSAGSTCIFDIRFHHQMPLFPYYREKYREHIRKKYRTPEDEYPGHGVHVPLNEKYSKLIIASEKGQVHELLNRPWRHTAVMSEQMAAITINAVFETDSGSQTVVLLGVAGVGKTTMARKIMLDWAAGTLFPERFDYVFYLSCRQMDLVKGQTNLADLILNNDPEFTEREVITKLLVNPGKVLFIIDGFNELSCSIEDQEDNLSIDPSEKKPIGVLLSKLFHKTVLLESCLLITTRPSTLGSLKNCLQSPRYVRLLGFSEEGKDVYFLKFFGNKKLATQALSYVKGNEALFSMSFIPNICWIICAVMKEQLDRGKNDLVPASEKLTAVYALYLSHLTKSPCSSSEQQNLRGLCSLAAEGIWKKKLLFKDEEIQKKSLAHLDSLPSAWCEILFRKDPDYEDIYRFLHLSVQEFLAALFYVFEDMPKDSETTEQNLKHLLERCSKSQGDLTLVQFIFSLLNREIRKFLSEQFGWEISSTIKADFLEWLKMDTQVKLDYPNYDPLERFHYLYAIQEEEFVKCALDHLTELTMERLIVTQLDQSVLSFCLKNCLNLEALSLYRCLFLPKELPQHLHQSCQSHQETLKHSAIYFLCEALKDPNSKIRKLELDGCQLTDCCCVDLATVLSTNQMLLELDLQSTSLKDSGVMLLCKGLIHPNCKLEILGLWDCDLTSACCSDLSTVLSTSQTLIELKLGDNPLLGDQGVHLLCEGLKYPNCKLQSLGLEECDLTAASCQDLILVLSTSQTLMKLNLERTKVGDAGVKLLCEGLKHPNCKLQTLLVGTSELTLACCGDLASVICTGQTLTELALEYNKLEDSGVRLLCEGLKQPNCKLQKLRLAQCNVTPASCRDLSSALTVNQTLTELDVECNRLGDSGVKVLCEGLKHPHGKLQILNLFNCDITAACCGDLASVLSSNQTLTELYLGCNKLGNSGVKLLCEGLKHPKCKLQKLCLCESEITAAGCGEISSALSTSHTLEDIDLWNNTLEDSGMRLLCEGLKHPDCKLQILSLCNCKFTAACCGDLCSVLSTNQSLKKLKLEGNQLGDSGVKLLCEGLKHPSCRMKTIGLDVDELTEDTVRELSCLKKIKPDLIIDA
ncbi:uncharacterized protein LOC133377971 [Rhineura floridana]|uniref:uncharacterized protein LOC133377971 n=1 Tax=Rhineura floridana TaxID=261503 RepID=UPI002AC86434|nr:uncharacterized protein LOC133377971 [Rhineura floridana]